MLACRLACRRRCSVASSSAATATATCPPGAVRPFDYYLFTSRSLTPRARRRRCRRPSADAADAATAAAAAAAADAVHAVCVACNNIASASNEQQVVVNQTIGSGVPCFVFPHSRAASSTDHRPNESSATAMAGLSSPPPSYNAVTTISHLSHAIRPIVQSTKIYPCSSLMTLSPTRFQAAVAFLR